MAFFPQKLSILISSFKKYFDIKFKLLTDECGGVDTRHNPNLCTLDGWGDTFDIRFITCQFYGRFSDDEHGT